MGVGFCSNTGNGFFISYNTVQNKSRFFILSQVADDGYGLSYLITAHTLIVHISAKKSSSLTVNHKSLIHGDCIVLCLKPPQSNPGASGSYN